MIRIQKSYESLATKDNFMRIPLYMKQKSIVNLK